MAKRMSVMLSYSEETDGEVVNKLREVDNKQDYIRQLILNDIGIVKENKTIKRGRKMQDITGMVFGEWTVLERCNDSKTTKYICKCSCGTVKSVSKQALIYGKSKGCSKCKYRRGKYNEMETHGFAADPRYSQNGKRTKIYTTWEGIKHRCYDVNHKSYKNYGGRGIKVYEGWIENFGEFYDYVTSLENYGKDGMTIDRIDNNKGYEPGNLRWATRAEQNRNRRKHK